MDVHTKHNDQQQNDPSGQRQELLTILSSKKDDETLQQHMGHSGILMEPQFSLTSLASCCDFSRARLSSFVSFRCCPSFFCFWACLLRAMANQ